METETSAVSLSDAQKELLGFVSGYGRDTPLSALTDYAAYILGKKLRQTKLELRNLVKHGLLEVRMYAAVHERIGVEVRQPEEPCYTLTDHGVAYCRESLGAFWLHHADSTGEGSS